jgi:hypothetical protein
MDFLVGLHSGIRWLVVVVWVVVVLRYLLAWALNPKFRPFDRYIYSALSILIDINVLVGLTVLVVAFINDQVRMTFFQVAAHMGLLLFAAATVHVANRRIKTLLDNEPKEKFFVGWVAALFAGLLIFIGVAFAGGWGNFG